MYHRMTSYTGSCYKSEQVGWQNLLLDLIYRTILKVCGVFLLCLCDKQVLNFIYQHYVTHIQRIPVLKLFKDRKSVHLLTDFWDCMCQNNLIFHCFWVFSKMWIGNFVNYWPLSMFCSLDARKIGVWASDSSICYGRSVRLLAFCFDIGGRLLDINCTASWFLITSVWGNFPTECCF